MEKPSDRGCYTISFLNATKRLSKGSGKKHISWDSILHPDPSSSIFYLATVVQQNYSIHRYSCCWLHYHKKYDPSRIPDDTFLTRIAFFKCKNWRITTQCVYSIITSVLTVSFVKKAGLSQIATLARNLLFWYVP